MARGRGAVRLAGARSRRVNYHVKTLEQHGLVELVEERRKGNMTERVVQASAAAYVISPAALATSGLDAEVRFGKPADRAAFVNELTDALTRIISKYHTETGRPHRLVVAVHPSITEDADPTAEEQQS